jgi:putative ABC transport system substrate-binding protein
VPDMKRRQFITLLGGAAVAWPMAARAQQPAMPVIGFLGTKSPGDDPHLVTAFRRGLKEAGYVEGQNVAIEFRFAENHYDRLAALAADLARRGVAVIVADSGIPAAIAAKAATTTVPIVFEVGVDPVETGLVASLNRPGGNATGVTSLNVEVAPKQLELMREFLPRARVIALLINPTNPNADTLLGAAQAAAHSLGLQLQILRAGTERDFTTVFAALEHVSADGLVIGVDPFLYSRSAELGALAGRHAIPAVSAYRVFPAAGGLASYGGSVTDAYRLVGSYTGRIVKGEKPADLPVQRVTSVELIVNLKAAKALGLEVPPTLLARADEVIE